ncbi:MAG: hypothetical protein ABI277_06100 [Burkholderiaceae bacterium]
MLVRRRLVQRSRRRRLPGLPHDFAIDDPETTRSIHQSVADALEEDRAMISLQVASLAKRPDFRMPAIRADAALARFRRMVDRILKEEAAAAPAVTPIEPVPSRADTVSA